MVMKIEAEACSQRKNSEVKFYGIPKDSANWISWGELTKMGGCWWSESCDRCDERIMNLTVLIPV